MADIVETADNAGNFKTLLQAAIATELVELLKSPGPYTLFAPTDEAFANLPEGTLDSLLLQNLPKLKRILAYHVAFGDVMAEDLMQIQEVETVEGSIVIVDTSSGIKVNDAKVITPDILADNGVIHVIDAVLIPIVVAAE